MLWNSQNGLEKSLICQRRSGRWGKRKELSHSEEGFLAGGSICATSAKRVKQTNKQKITKHSRWFIKLFPLMFEDVIKKLKYWVFHVLDMSHCITLRYSLALHCIILGDCLKPSYVVCHQCSMWDFLQVFKDNNETWGLYPFQQVSQQNITDVHYHMNLAQFLNPQNTVISKFTLYSEWKKVVILFFWKRNCDKQSAGNNHVKFTVT